MILIIIPIRVLVKLKPLFMIVSLRIEKQIFYVVFFVENPFQTHKSRIPTVFDHTEEKWYIVASQVFLPFMIAGFGMVAAGLVLERVKVFIELIPFSFDSILSI